MICELILKSLKIPNSLNYYLNKIIKAQINKYIANSDLYNEDLFFIYQKMAVLKGKLSSSQHQKEMLVQNLNCIQNKIDYLYYNAFRYMPKYDYVNLNPYLKNQRDNFHCDCWNVLAEIVYLRQQIKNKKEKIDSIYQKLNFIVVHDWLNGNTCIQYYTCFSRENYETLFKEFRPSEKNDLDASNRDDLSSPYSGDFEQND